jgi:hypothetical protein
MTQAGSSWGEKVITQKKNYRIRLSSHFKYHKLSLDFHVILIC